jgi:hypothetical protein
MHIVHVPSDFRRYGGLGSLGQTGVDLKARMTAVSAAALGEFNQRKNAVVNQLKLDYAVVPQPLRWVDCMENAGDGDNRFKDGFDGDWDQDAAGDARFTSLHAARFCGQTAGFMHDILTQGVNYRQIMEVINGTRKPGGATRQERYAYRWACWLIMKAPDAFNRSIFKNLDRRTLASNCQGYWGDAEDFYWGRLYCYGQAFIGKALSRSIERGWGAVTPNGQPMAGAYPFQIDESIYFISSMDKMCDPVRQPEWFESWGSTAIAGGVAAGAAAVALGLYIGVGATVSVTGALVTGTLFALGPVGWLVLACAAVVAAGIFAFLAVYKNFRENPEFKPGEREIVDDYAYGIMLWTMLLRGWYDKDERKAFKSDFLEHGGYTERGFELCVGNGSFFEGEKKDYRGEYGPFGWVTVYTRASEVCPDGFIKVQGSQPCPVREFEGSNCPVLPGNRLPKPCGGVGGGYCGDRNLMCVDGCCKHVTNYVSDDMKADVQDLSIYSIPDNTNRNIAIMASIGVAVIAGAYLLGRKV